MRTRPRKTLLFSFLTGLTVLALASTAFACTVYRGKFTIQGRDNNGVLQPAVSAVGANGYTTGTNGSSGMSFCSTVPPQAQISWSYKFTAKTANASECQKNGYNKLSTTYNPYYLLFGSGPAYYGDCMAGQAGLLVVKNDDGTNATIRVNSDGSSTGSQSSWYLPYDAPRGEGDICISDAAAYEGNQIPINVL